MIYLSTPRSRRKTRIFKRSSSTQKRNNIGYQSLRDWLVSTLKRTKRYLSDDVLRDCNRFDTFIEPLINIKAIHSILTYMFVFIHYNHVEKKINFNKKGRIFFRFYLFKGFELISVYNFYLYGISRISTHFIIYLLFVMIPNTCFWRMNKVWKMKEFCFKIYKCFALYVLLFIISNKA